MTRLELKRKLISATTDEEKMDAVMAVFSAEDDEQIAYWEAREILDYRENMDGRD